MCIYTDLSQVLEVTITVTTANTYSIPNGILCKHSLCMLHAVSKLIATVIDTCGKYTHITSYNIIISTSSIILNYSLFSRSLSLITV